MPAPGADLIPVVTAFLYRRGRVLLLRRSQRVSTHRGKWCGVSGYLERPPVIQARSELLEEAGVAPSQAFLRGIGLPLVVPDPQSERTWLVFTFLFRAPPGVSPRLDWESEEYAWVSPNQVGDLDTVPGLAAGLSRVWPPWGPPGFWRGMEAIAANTTEGATALALRGLRALDRLRLEDRRRGLRAFAALHPSMGLFPHLAARALSRRASPSTLARRLDAATSRSADRAARALTPYRRILTHSASQACRETIIRWWQSGAEVVVTESRPQCEGIALARGLAAAGVRVTLVSDAQLGLFVPRCDAVLVGADAITEDDHLINKAGTRLAVLAAREAGVPAFAVAQTFKICPAGWPLALTPHDPAQLARVRGLRVSNIAFDATPLSWFTAVVTERGPITPARVDDVRRSLPALL
jgi:translation initiation factor eIF-2B subunit delta